MAMSWSARAVMASDKATQARVELLEAAGDGVVVVVTACDVTVLLTTDTKDNSYLLQFTIELYTRDYMLHTAKALCRLSI